MTEKLWYASPMLTSCEAEVISSEERDGKYLLRLDRTVIFPAGGGQPSDMGSIGEAKIIEAIEDGNEVIHVTDRALPVGARVTARLDVPRRLDHSEQHTGEHILSGLAAKLFGAKNVGFHMAEDYSTLDLDVCLDADSLALLEREANAAVRRNVPVTCEIMDREKFDSITIRKKSEVKSDEIRVVFIGGGEVDSCTCCGTHCASSGEVGFIRIADSQKYKGGTRIWFSAGGRAVNEANGMTRELKTIAKSFSTSCEELPAAIKKQSDELANLKRELKSRTQALCRLIAEANTDEAPVMMMEGFGANDVKLLTDSLIDSGARVALVFGRRGSAVSYRAVRKQGEKIPMNDIALAVNALKNGKGGGSPDFAQGAVPSPLTEEELDTLRDYIKRRIKTQRV
ncbi:MAG: hypothetical protein K6F68_07065 [Clostridiales bacterium]|nr:hypothetical protein [Clostridiales bacterium]